VSEKYEAEKGAEYVEKMRQELGELQIDAIAKIWNFSEKKGDYTLQVLVRSLE
jgi:hypothetical protein